MLDVNNCCGCNNCVVLCPTKAITMKINKYGFEEPVIDSDKCIKCGKCTRNCPSMTCKELNISQKVYAVWSKEEEIRKNSASGGISVELARNTLAKGGVVYGTSYDRENFVHVKRIDSMKDLLKIQGSRYVKSNMGNTVELIREDLKERKVLFIGTPCQCSAIKNAIGDNDKLILVDLICHGTPPQTFLQEEIKSQGFSEPMDDIQFRRNGRCELQFFKDNKNVFLDKWGKNYYFNAFMNALTYQEACYSCKYATKERVGNISVGDFWGLDMEWVSKHAPKTGISLVMVNDAKGMEAFSECEEQIMFYERTLDEAVKGNAQLRGASHKHAAREQFKEDYAKHGYQYAMKKNLFFAVLKKKIKYMINKNEW